MGILDGIMAVEEKGHRPILFLTGVCSSAAYEQIFTPPEGFHADIHYMSYNPDNGPVEIGFYVSGGAAAYSFFVNKLLVGGAIFAKDFRLPNCLELDSVEGLYLFQDVAVNTRWTLCYTLKRTEGE